MQKKTGIALLALGIILLAVGFDEKDAVSSQLSQTFTGTPSNKELMLFSAGGLASASGIAMVCNKKAIY